MCLMQDFRLSTSRAVSFGTAGLVANLSYTEWNGKEGPFGVTFQIAHTHNEFTGARATFEIPRSL